MGAMGIHEWLEVGQLAATLLLVPAIKVLWGIKEEIAAFKLYAAQTYATKEDLRDHKCGN